jgi:hypothetical protein
MPALLVLIAAATLAYKWRGNDWWTALLKGAVTVYAAYLVVLGLTWLINR